MPKEPKKKWLQRSRPILLNPSSPKAYHKHRKQHPKPPPPPPPKPERTKHFWWTQKHMGLLVKFQFDPICKIHNLNREAHHLQQVLGRPKNRPALKKTSRTTSKSPQTKNTPATQQEIERRSALFGQSTSENTSSKPSKSRRLKRTKATQRPPKVTKVEQPQSSQRPPVEQILFLNLLREV